MDLKLARTKWLGVVLMVVIFLVMGINGPIEIPHLDIQTGGILSPSIYFLVYFEK